MNQFKRIMLAGHTQEKNYLHKLYTDRQVYISSVSSAEQPVAEEKIYYYKELSFQFMGTGFRTMEKLVMFIFIPEKVLPYREFLKECSIAYEDFLLYTISDSVNQLSEKYKNDRKNSREKADFSMQTVTSVIQRRNGCSYFEEKEEFRLRVNFCVPLINEKRVNGKAAFKNVREVLDIISDCLTGIDKTELLEHIQLYLRQFAIRNYLKEYDFVAFIANGSILPREGESDLPMNDAKPFFSPKENEIEISLPDGSSLTGMGIKKGITVITGGGYSGKSTLLNSLEAGIYHHRKGDGREYVITERTACKIYAEDGRYINNMDISPFFSFLPEEKNRTHFSTKRASGSVSQAVNILECLYAGSSLFLIDEDTSAANFMIHDKHMRMLVKQEPIIPFTDRIMEIKNMGYSVILVIGGSSEYLRYADQVLLMEDYQAINKTEYVKKIVTKTVAAWSQRGDYGKYQWTENRYLSSNHLKNDFYYSKTVKIENARYIQIDDFLADITKMTAIISDEQINSLAFLLERLLMEAREEKEDLIQKCRNNVDKLFLQAVDAMLINTHKYELWLEEIRGIDLFMAVSRMRGIEFL